MTTTLRPSEAGRWVNCPASPRLQQPFPDVPSPDAEEGTAAHWAAAQVLQGHHALDELTDRAAPNGVIITGDMVEHIQMYVDTVTPNSVIERPLPSAIPGVEDGTPDALRVDGFYGHIWDFKYGWGIVEARGNWQLACYAVNMFAKHDWKLEQVTCHIVQPRPYHYDGRVRSWKVTRDDARGLHEQLITAVGRTVTSGMTTRVPAAVTGPHCKYCRALHVCEAARRAGLNAVDVAYSGSPVDMQGVALSGELRTLKRAADAIKLRLDALESHAISTIDAGGIVPGWSMERALGRRTWKDDNVTALEVLSGVTLTESKPVTPAQAEKRGVDPLLVKQFTTAPETGRKLVERDTSAKAKEVFGDAQ